MLLSTFAAANAKALDLTAHMPGNTFTVFAVEGGFQLVNGSGHYSAPKGELVGRYLNGKRTFVTFDQFCAEQHEGEAPRLSLEEAVKAVTFARETAEFADAADFFASADADKAVKAAARMGVELVAMALALRLDLKPQSPERQAFMAACGFGR